MNADEFKEAWGATGGQSGLRHIIMHGGRISLYANHYTVAHIRKEEVGKEVEDWDCLTLSRIVGRSVLIDGATVRVEDVERII